MVHHTRRTFLKAGGATAIALLASAQLVHGSGSPGSRVAITPAPDQFGYRTMVGRSGQATGPNVDREGVLMLKRGADVVAGWQPAMAGAGWRVGSPADRRRPHRIPCLWRGNGQTGAANLQSVMERRLAACGSGNHRRSKIARNPRILWEATCASPALTESIHWNYCARPTRRTRSSKRGSERKGSRQGSILR